MQALKCSVKSLKMSWVSYKFYSDICYQHTYTKCLCEKDLIQYKHAAKMHDSKMYLQKYAAIVMESFLRKYFYFYLYILMENVLQVSRYKRYK